MKKAQIPFNGTVYTSTPPSSVFSDWFNSHVKANIFGRIVSAGHLCWYGVIEDSSDTKSDLKGYWTKIVWDRGVQPRDIKIFVGVTQGDCKWQLQFCTHCNIHMSAKSGLNKFQFIIMGDRATLVPIKPVKKPFIFR